LKEGAEEVVLEVPVLPCCVATGLDSAVKIDVDCALGPAKKGEMLFISGVFEDVREDRPAKGLDGAEAVKALAELPSENIDGNILMSSDGCNEFCV
jgi:hypothetical protein